MRRGGPRVGPGTYTLRLAVDGETMTRELEVEIDPDNPDPVWLSNEQANEAFQAENGTLDGDGEGDEETDGDR